MIEKKRMVNLSLIEQVQLILHTAMCDACKAYQKQSVLMEKFLIKRSRETTPQADNSTLSEEAKAKIIDEIKNQ